MANAQEAEQIVRHLTSKYGYLNEKMMDDIEQFNPEYRRDIDKNWMISQDAVSHTVKILAKQIYGSGARFVFELAQNADDNAFKKATAGNVPPFISFKIHPNRIIVDCNEDGFTEPDLEAICEIGKSTKSASHGYIGAKGIGFKSVFIAASRVHIQSGHFSFEFRHKKTDPGIGMVRPIWVHPVETIPNPLTRMTLHLHDRGDQSEIQHLKTIISMQFDELQATCLLFLRKLQQITLEFYDENGDLQRSKTFRKQMIDEYRVSLETTSYVDGKKTTQSQIYHITKQTATGLAQSDNRELPDTDGAQGTFSTAEVVLAFPVTDNFKPLVTQRNQDLFAFLPLRQSNYKFLIHSDFDTNASRQDIVTTSRRNLDLRTWIATTLFKAVLQFCEHPALCYDWPMFLPSPDNSSDVFWSGLDHVIQDMMKEKPTLKSRNRSDLRLISDVFILASNEMDENGRPLLDDPAKDLYLSPNYSQAAVKVLKDYGLQPISVDTLMDLLKTDLYSANPRMYGKDMTDAWHSAVARMLSLWCINSQWTKLILGFLPLLPLRNGEWTLTGAGPVYFSKTGDINIPESLPLKIISPSASDNPDRRTLFQHLGVLEATIDQVRASIFKIFTPNYKHSSIATFKAYLEFLYLTHQPNTQVPEGSVILALTDGLEYKNPHQVDIYLPVTNHGCSPMSLLPARGTPQDLYEEFLDSTIMKNAPERPISSHPSWERWLCDVVGIRERLRLLEPTSDYLSRPFLYVLEHRPDKFLALFEHLWPYEKSRFLSSQTLRSRIQYLSAKELCGVNFSIRLGKTWLPFQHLRDSVMRYMEHPEQFPFLKLPESDMAQRFETRWDFLTKYFSVGKDDNVDFFLGILSCIETSCPKPSSVRQSQMVFDLYVAIYAKLTVANDEPGVRRKIRQYFSVKGILDPDEKAPTWTSSSSCLWVAPPDMTSAHSLRTLYSRRLGDEQMGTMENLFQRTLEIRDASLKDLVTELEALREKGCEDIARMRALYNYLNESEMSVADASAAFEESALIYHVTRHGESGWYKTSDCLWSSETTIRGKVTLDECWEAHKSFFVNKLGVKFLTLQMVYDELRQSPQSSIEDIKVAILSLNGLLQTEQTHLDPEPIRKAKIFPVRYPNGTVALTSVGVDFAIGDRDKLKERFQDKINILDFELEDVRRLKPLFEWASLQDRYLSCSVKERTSVSTSLGRPISSRHRDLKRKAYHIVRVAATFHSPRFEDNPDQLYEQLRAMRVLEVDGISSVLEMFQNKQLFRVEVATANEHIDDRTSEGLTIYVPRELRAQELCFGSVLPRKLAGWLMRRSTSDGEGPVEVEVDAVNALTSIFACDQSVLDDILDDQGIIQVSLENRDQGYDDEDEKQEMEEQQGQFDIPFQTGGASSEEQMTPAHSSANDSSISYVQSPHTEPTGGITETVVETISRQSQMSHQPRLGGGDDPSRPPPLHDSSLSLNTSNSHALSSTLSTRPESPSEDAQYRAILDRVVQKARRTTFGAINRSGMRDTLSGGVRHADAYESFDGLDVVGTFRSTNQLERDKKIGAAGELFVFELLSKLEMPGWDRGNWQSTIRSYVTIHPDYTTMGAWNRRETADLVYVDSAGHFTDMLISCGYLDHEDWHGARPKYYIEVKTTTGPCSTPFYMSGKQYRLMQRIHSTEDRSEVYMIFRVFWLNDDGIGLNVYFDPEKLRQDGQLEFTGQTWSVTPVVGTEADG